MHFCQWRKFTCSLPQLSYLIFHQKKQRVETCLHKQVAFHLSVGIFSWNPSTDTKRTNHFTEACVQEKKKERLVSCGNKRDTDRHSHVLFPYQLQFHRKLLIWNIKSLSNFFFFYTIYVIFKGPCILHLLSSFTLWIPPGLMSMFKTINSI